MNDIIKEQLKKCKIAKIPFFDDTTKSLIVSKSNNNIYEEKTEIKLLQDHYYIIKLKYYIINPPDNFTLASNWNRGVNPKSEYMLGTPIKFLGKMIQWDCCGYDYISKENLNDTYMGLWLPLAGFEVIEMRDY